MEKNSERIEASLTPVNLRRLQPDLTASSVGGQGVVPDAEKAERTQVRARVTARQGARHDGAGRTMHARAQLTSRPENAGS
jgi:hypothetical protein